VTALINSNSCLLSIFAIFACPLLGDINKDDQLNGADVAGFVHCALGYNSPNENCYAGDFNIDGSVDELDIGSLVNAILDSENAIGIQYGVTFEDGVAFAYIRVRNGPELVAVAFDPQTETEDFTTQRFFGFTESELNNLPEFEDPSLVISPLTCEAARLWETNAFPDFTGTPGQLQLLNRQSQVLAVLLSMLGVDTNGWSRGVNGCTDVPDFDVVNCCNDHDRCYEGCPEFLSRSECDDMLYSCIQSNSVFPGLAAAYYAGVRAFGNPFYEGECMAQNCETCDPELGCVQLTPPATPSVATVQVISQSPPFWILNITNTSSSDCLVFSVCKCDATPNLNSDWYLCPGGNAELPPQASTQLLIPCVGSTSFPSCNGAVWRVVGILVFPDNQCYLTGFFQDPALVQAKMIPLLIPLCDP